MDEAGKIADGSQVLNTDETPQQRAYAQARRNELLAGAKGHSLAPPRARTRGRARRGTPRVERRRDAAVLLPVAPFALSKHGTPRTLHTPDHTQHQD
mmetsp:Transcript_20293/g.50762  ORF Transcript_20293/g.50762 Transcript_20293/m.50762 type:complete len:97 (-) Transcript_20293:57-347(-)